MPLHTCRAQGNVNHYIAGIKCDTQAPDDRGLSGGKDLQGCRESGVPHHIDTAHDGDCNNHHHNTPLLGHDDIDLHSLARNRALLALYGCSVVLRRHRNDRHSSLLFHLASIRCDLGWA